MAFGNDEFDLKQLVLYGGSFGPREIDQIRDVISTDVKKYEELKEIVNELKTKDDEERTPAEGVKLGVCQFLIGDYNSAFESLKKGDGGALAHFYFAKIHLANKRYEDAIAEYNTAQKAGYPDGVCALGRAETYREQGDLELSLQELDKLSGPIEQTAEYLYQRAATIDAIGGNIDEVVALYERALTVDKNHPGALFGLARENDRCGNDEEALNLYKRAASQFPTNLGTLVNLGILYEDLERYDLAQQCYQRVLEAYPTNKRARLFLKDSLESHNVRYDDDDIKKSNELNQTLNRSVAEFELSVRSRKTLEEMGVKTIRDLCKHTEADFLAYKNFGDTSLKEIKDLLGRHGLELGSQSPDKQRLDPYDAATLSPEEQQKLLLPVSQLNLSVRARRAMGRLEIQTIGELVSRSADELLDCKNFGITSLKEIREKLQQLGLKLKGD